MELVLQGYNSGHHHSKMECSRKEEGKMLGNHGHARLLETKHQSQITRKIGNGVTTQWLNKKINFWSSE